MASPAGRDDPAPAALLNLHHYSQATRLDMASIPELRDRFWKGMWKENIKTDLKLKEAVDWLTWSKNVGHEDLNKWKPSGTAGRTKFEDSVWRVISEEGQDESLTLDRRQAHSFLAWRVFNHKGSLGPKLESSIKDGSKPVQIEQGSREFSR